MLLFSVSRHLSNHVSDLMQHADFCPLHVQHCGIHWLFCLSCTLWPSFVRRAWFPHPQQPMDIWMVTMLPLLWIMLLWKFVWGFVGTCFQLSWLCAYQWYFSVMFIYPCALFYFSVLRESLLQVSLTLNPLLGWTYDCCCAIWTWQNIFVYTHRLVPFSLPLPLSHFFETGFPCVA